MAGHQGVYARLHGLCPAMTRGEMEKRKFGRTGLSISVLTFGCGAVGGLMTRARPPIRSARSRVRSRPASIISTPRRSTATARRRKISAACWRALKPDVIVSTKVRLPARAQHRRRDRGLARNLAEAAEARSCRSVPAAQHDRRARRRADDERGRSAGRRRAGASTARASRARRASSASRRSARPRRCIELIASGAFDTAQVPYNALNPSPAEAIPAAYPAQDYGRILDLAGAARRRHHRHPRARGRRAVGQRGAQSARACRRSSRSARARAMRWMLRARGGSSRWCARAMPAA